MCNYLLKPLITKFKNQDMSVFPLIYDEFKRLISLYAARLHYEDTLSELNLFFVELLLSMDLSRFPSDESVGIRRYIAVSIKNRYIALSIKECKTQKYSALFFENSNGYSESIDDRILLAEAFCHLSDKQRLVLIYRYVYGYSDFEIAQRLSVTRQAVNGMKLRALENLRELILE